MNPATGNTWLDVLAGIIGIAATAVGVIYSFLLIRKTQLEIRKTSLEIREKERQSKTRAGSDKSRIASPSERVRHSRVRNLNWKLVLEIMFLIAFLYTDVVTAIAYFIGSPVPLLALLVFQVGSIMYVYIVLLDMWGPTGISVFAQATSQYRNTLLAATLFTFVVQVLFSILLGMARLFSVLVISQEAMDIFSKVAHTTLNLLIVPLLLITFVSLSRVMYILAVKKSLTEN